MKIVFKIKLIAAIVVCLFAFNSFGQSNSKFKVTLQS